MPPRGRDFLTGILIGSAVTAAVIGYFSFDGRKDKRKKEKAASAPQRSSTRSIVLQTQSSFLTDILEQLWVYIKIAGADTIRESVEPSFADLPGPMKTCRFTNIDLGDVPIRMDNIVVHPLENGMMKFDLDLVWDGECDIQLKADYIGSFGVRHLKLSGRMAILLKPLTNELPIVSGIQYGFINPPKIQLFFSGLASVADLSVLESSVQHALQSSLSSVVLPNRMLYKMNSDNNYLDTFQPPVGIARITVKSGRNFVIEKRLFVEDDIPDVHLNITLGAGPETWKTKTIQDDCNPTWNESGEFCLFDHEQMLQVHAWDEDKGPLDPDDELGFATVSIGELLMAPQRTMELSLIMPEDEEETGSFITLSCDVCEWTSDVQSLNCDSAASPATRKSVCGLLIVIINRAFNLPLEKITASTYVKVTYGDTTFDSTIIYDYPGWDPLNPIYDSAFTIPITPQMPRGDDAVVQLDLINAGEQQTTILGSTSVSFGDLKCQKDNTLTEQRPIGDYGASLEFRVSLSGIKNRSNNGEPSLSYQSGTEERSARAIAPGTSLPTRKLPTTSSNDNGNRLDFDGEPKNIGTVRVTVLNGRGLKIQQELFSFDVPDMYCELRFGDDAWKTSVKHNSVNPEWNESKEFLLMDPGQIIEIIGWDKNEGEYDPEVSVGTTPITSFGKMLMSAGSFDIELKNDVSIGAARITVGKLLMAGGSMDLELKEDGRATGVHIALQCDMVE